jgi:phosphoesterase RecJ-like protein
MKPNCHLSEIAEVLRTRENFLVLSHIRPDGDAIGCSLAVGLALRALGKKVSIWNEDGLPDRFRFLPESTLLCSPPEAAQPFEVVVVVDTAVRSRAGDRCLRAVADGALWINIDHHVSNDRLGDLVYIDSEAPAAGQILYELFVQTGLPLTPSMAAALYVAISTDTGSFQYPSTTARTYQIAADLLERGVDVGWINQQIYQCSPRRRLELLRSLLNVLQFSGNDRVASFSLARATARQLGLIPDDTEGMIDVIRSLEGVLVAAFFEETDGGLIRMSLRSKDPSVDVCAICREFGGGGHVLASGARVAGKLEDVQAAVLAAIEKRLPEVPSQCSPVSAASAASV